MFKILKSGLGFLLLLAGIVIWFSAVNAFFDKSRYLAIARVKIEQDGTGGGQDKLSDHTHFIRNQYDVILSEAVLGEAVGSIAQAVVNIKDHLSLHPVNSVIFKIRFLGDDPTNAAVVANAIAGAYQDYQTELSQSNRLSPNFAKVQIIEFAEPPSSPMPMALIATLMMGAGFIPICLGLLLLKFSRRRL